MATTTERVGADVKAQAEEIVSSGTNVRPRLEEVVSQAASAEFRNANRAVRNSGEVLLTLIRAVVDGAREGLARSVPADRDDVLRQVVDALADGISQTALAGRLALQESASASQFYAKEDLARLRDNLTSVRKMFTETVGQGLESCKELTTSQFNRVMTHAERAAQGLSPVFTRVLDAIEQQPLTLARESIHAGVNMVPAAAGSLFLALGRLLEQAGGASPERKQDQGTPADEAARKPR